MISKVGLKHVFMGMLAVILAFSTTSIAYAETTPGIEVVNAASQVTVHVYDNNNQISNVEGSGEEITDSSAVQGLGTAIEGATVSYYKVGELVQYTTNGSTSLKYAVSESAATIFGWSTDGKTEVTINNGTDVKYYLFDANELSNLLSNITSSDLKGKGDSGSWTDLTTDVNGLASTSDTLSGLYLFVGKSMPEGVTTEVAPFFVSAPMPADGSWNTDIHVYPKVQTADAMQITHEVKYKDPDGSYAQSMSANSGTTLEYQIEVTIPQNVKNLKTFLVEVSLPAELSLVENTGKLTATGINLTTGDYALSSTGGTVSLSISDAGVLDKFDGDGEEGSTIIITYEAKINNAAPLAAPIENTAKLNYQFENAVAVDPAPTATATVYTYGIDLTKTFEGATEYPDENAQFSLYTDQDCLNVVEVGISNGEYWVDSSSSTTAMDVAQIEATADGTLTIKGLAAGTYYLKETVAPDGYGKIQNPITIVVNKGTTYDSLEDNIKNPTATVNGAKATIDAAGTGTKDGLVQLTVENQQLLFGFLPKTGDVGTFIFIAAGIGLVCAAVVYLTSRRRKNISNSH